MLTMLALAVAAGSFTGPADSGTLDLTFPQAPAVTEFTDSFGAPRSGHSHQGNDLMAPKMTEVVAVADGTVLWVRDSGSAGRYLVVEHAGGWESWYMHLNDDTPGTDDGSAPMSLGVVVQEGDTVVAGQLIGYVGDSGNAEGSSAHTHFELHRDGVPVDPHDLLRAARRRALIELRTTPLIGIRLS
jgi:murein DD-endopeptidase MepM/ murein hydrolase activator NlpD